MSSSVENSIQRLLQTLASVERDDTGEAWVSGRQLQENTDLSPAEINDAATILRERGLVEWRQYLGTAPFIFGQLTITPRGRYELSLMEEQELRARTRPSDARTLQLLQLPVTPVGSPYGFTDLDWEIIAERKSTLNELRVVLGCQFESEYYDTEQLKSNINGMFQKAVDEYNQMPTAIHVSLVFQSLTAGYGEHLFNEIARDIMSADIAVFEASDQNPNVMIEMGVALTWGIRVLPIKQEGRPRPPSDISGQTWADYRNNAAEFVDPDHHSKLVRMVERAARKKGRS